MPVDPTAPHALPACLLSPRPSHAPTTITPCLPPHPTTTTTSAPPPTPQTDLTHINILAELYCDAGQWAAALATVQRAERELLAPDEELPIDLRVRGWGGRGGVCGGGVWGGSTWGWACWPAMAGCRLV